MFFSRASVVGVAQAGVLVAGLAAEAGGAVVGVAEGEGAALVDGGGHGAGGGVDVLTGVDELGAESAFLDILHGCPFLVGKFPGVHMPQ